MGFFTSATKDDRKARIKVIKEEPCRVTLSIIVPLDRIKDEIEKAFEGIRSQAKLPGFRPGKAPLEVVRENFTDLATQRTQEAVVRDAVREAITLQNLEPVQTPVVKSMNFQPGQPFSFELEVERAPRVELKGYRGLKAEKKLRKITEADVSARLEEIREANSRLTESQKTQVESGSFAVVDYEGFLEGKPLPGARGTQVLVDTANPQMITGLAEGIIGMTTRETKEIPVDFPQDSPSRSLAGKRVLFKVTLSAIKEKQRPSLDDEFAKDIGCSSLDDLKAKIKSSLEERAARAGREVLEDQLVENLLQQHNFPVPSSLLEEQVQRQLGAEKQRWLDAGGSEAEWPQNEQVLVSKVRPECERQLKWAYLMREICRQEKIQVDEKEVREAIDQITGSATAPERAAVQRALEGRRDRISSDIRSRKVFDFLISQAKVKEIEYPRNTAG
jgi:trigger factor